MERAAIRLVKSKLKPSTNSAWIQPWGRHGYLPSGHQEDAGYALAYLRHSIDHGGRIAVLDDIWIAGTWRGLGLGARLLNTVCEDLRAVGARAVLLEVDPANEVAISLYSRFGFTHTGTASTARALRSLEMLGLLESS